MAEGILTTTEEELDAALKAAEFEKPDPAVRSAQFLRENRLLLLCLTNGQRLAIPVEDLEDLKGATDDQLSELEILGPGTAIHFTRFGHGVYVPMLVKGVYGSRKWMEQLRALRNAA